MTWIEQIVPRGLPTTLTDLVSRPVSWLMLDTVPRRVCEDARTAVKAISTHLGGARARSLAGARRSD